MSQDSSLQELVLGYCRQVGGIIEPPAYGCFEILLPEEVARRWGTNPYLNISFDPEVRGNEIVSLYYGHPLVEAMVAELRQQSANARLFINPSRVEKPGLRELAEQTFTFPNARLEVESVPRNRLYQYVCFNFKASLVSDEKHELITSVWMHLQGGYRVFGSELLSQASLSSDTHYNNLEPAPPSWRTLKPGESPLSPEILAALLERARYAVLDEIAPTLETVQRRSQRFLALDRARLEDYYADLQRDLEKRLSKAEEDRRSVLESKLAVLQVERQSKLADIEHKYHLRLDLELINLAIVSQPKIELEASIGKRGVKSKRTLSWDALLHRFDPLACDVCGRSGEGLYLCESGHLAHADCLSPQCVDCKRTFCQLCADKVHQCVVCDKPVCVHSLARCKNCGRETCQQHAELCHAAEGKPQRLPVPVEAPPVSQPTPSMPPRAETKKPPKGRAERAALLKPPPAKVERKPRAVIGQRVEVEVEFGKAEVTAFVLVKDRQLAARHWALTDEGILVHCSCEKEAHCQYNGLIYRPMGSDRIEQQIYSQIKRLAEEYQVPEKKISFWRIITGESFPERQLNLGARWKNAETLAQAQEGFDRMRRW